jgi:cell division protein FtsQ
MNKFKHIALWVLVVMYLAATLSFVADRQQRIVCSQVEVRIVDSLQNGFVSEKNIQSLFQKKGITLIGKNFREIDLEMLENIVNNYAPVEKAEVFKTISGKIVVEVKQRTPILRIIDLDNESYYIDNNGYIMRLNGNYTSHAIIANGYIRSNFQPSNKTNVLEMEQKSSGKRIILAELFKLAQFIVEHKFWDTQIQQIFVNASGDFELIPRVGSHVIMFGDYSDCETKFDNLMSLYKHGFSATGWNKYETINLKYKGQVICTKRE